MKDLAHDHGALLQVDERIDLALGTLGAKAAILGPSNVDGSRANGMFIIWTKLAGFFAGKTTTEGPIIFGVCGNISATVLAEILADDPQSSQVPTKTGAGSWYYPIILIGKDATEGDLMGRVGSTNVQATSRFEKINVRWAIPEAQEFAIFAYNLDSSALSTGTTFQATMQIFGAWLRD